MRTVGFVGLGTMGAPMARNILRSGISVRVYDESRDARGAFADTRAVVCSTLPETYQGCESIVLMLPTIKEVETVLLGDSRALSEANSGCVIVNMSTVSPLENEKIASELHSRGLRFVEAPVARGSDNAHDGTLLIMAAGHTSAVEAVRPVFDTMGETIVCGGIGAASGDETGEQLFGTTVQRPSLPKPFPSRAPTIWTSSLRSTLWPIPQSVRGMLVSYIPRKSWLAMSPLGSRSSWP